MKKNSDESKRQLRGDRQWASVLCVWRMLSVERPKAQLINMICCQSAKYARTTVRGSANNSAEVSQTDTPPAEWGTRYR